MRLRLTIGAVGLAFLLAACGGTPTPQAESTEKVGTSTNIPSVDSPSQPGQHSHPPSSNPTVKDPIDPTPWETEPCAVLTNKQLNKLSIESTPEPGEGPTGPKCEWGDEFDDNISIDGSFSTKVESGIKELYDNAELNTYDYFEETEIGDYPAFFSSITVERM